MTSLLLQWLNDKLELHKKVKVLERDLSNGYIYAEILRLHGLEKHMDRYEDSDVMAVRVQNLERLDKTLTKIPGIGSLSTATKRAILMEDRSSIQQLLLRIKEYLESRRKKISPEQQRLQNVETRVMEPRKTVPGPQIRDVDERFVEETANQYHPTEVGFHKEINMAVHLRKFPQAQWNAENELIKHQSQMANGKANASAQNMHSLRTHLREKHTFMQQWDLERLEKWQATQRLFLKAEHDELRLELSLEERKKRFDAARTNVIQADAAEGVEFSEKNFNRLGLGGTAGGAEPVLRAIPTSDPGSLAHLSDLEKRVADLNFRPSNNVKMMKELRARRKAQLAAEKDRRVHRMMALNDARALTTPGNPSTTSPDIVEREQSRDVADEREPRVDPASVHDIVVKAYEQYFEANRDQLEENYTQLRNRGEQRREQDMEELERIRTEQRRDAKAHAQGIAEDAVEALIALAMMIIQDNRNTDASVKDIFLSITPSSPKRALPILCLEEQYELDQLTMMFYAGSGIWESLQSQQYEDAVVFNAPKEVESMIRCVISASASVASTTLASEDVLSTAWTSLAGSRLVSIFTADERGLAAAKRVAQEHHMECLDVDLLVDECMQHSYDPQKQADIAATWTPRQRELGAFGPKLASFRQKNTPIPEQMIVDIVVTAIMRCRSLPTEDRDDSVPEVAPSTEASCLLLNFPRSQDEAKLFEKAMIVQTNLDEENRGSQLAAFDSVSSTTPTSQEPSESSPAFVSCIDILIVLSVQPPSRPASAAAEQPQVQAQEVPSSAECRRTSSIAANSDSKKVLPIDPSGKNLLESEGTRRRELLQQAEAFLHHYTNVAYVDQTDMRDPVLCELLHLAIDEYASERLDSNSSLRFVECTSPSTLPIELASAREARRASLPAVERAVWMIQSNELVFDERAMMDFVVQLHHLGDSMVSAVKVEFAILQGVISRVVQVRQIMQRKVDEALESDSIRFKKVLDHAAVQLKQSSNQRPDRVLTQTEVDLGDLVDRQRICANRVVEQLRRASLPQSVSELVPWLNAISSICLELKEHVADAVDLLTRRFYSQFQFLACASSRGYQVQVPTVMRDGFRDAVVRFEEVCCDHGLPDSLGDDVRRMVDELLGSFDCVDELVTPSSYELHQQHVTGRLLRDFVLQIMRLMEYTSRLIERTKQVDRANAMELGDYVLHDVRLKNEIISTVMLSLRTNFQAHWPDLCPVLGYCGRDTFAHTLCRHQQSQFLSVEQIESWIGACRDVESAHLDGGFASLPLEDFIARTLEIARRDAFPSRWRDPKSLAAVAMEWSASHPRLAWRALVFSLICVQFTEFPKVEAILDYLASLVTMRRQITEEGEGGGDSFDVLSRQDFTQIPLWFEREEGKLEPREQKSIRRLLFTLFTTHDRPDAIQTLPMLLTWCVAHNADRDVETDALPSYSRGLFRAFRVITKWNALTTQQCELDLALFSVLLGFADVPADETVCLELWGTDRRGWREEEDSSFLSFCDAYDRGLARRFLAHNTLDALTQDGR
ncbi:hypothetical protein Poli38472_013896 [Pythium oligandrum]|uniref:Calponin-homology (CH) domain-containing protein n=1 Tax=Pythium oligandrum TaxID=41045 RepID=A0A8K1C290_PYTOL|nr:hypothetical protein Poli38472_013896 [Pythium oligandrum]|eukprot:TMW55134.1 hypothetical protein Poli38472_013896 [Pythium oligandrum]